MRMRLLTGVVAVALLLSGCVVARPLETIPRETEPVETAAPTVAAPPTAPTVPIHSPYYIPGLDVETLITYFNEIVLDAEFVEGGDATLVQKWDEKILYYIHGETTETDMTVFQSMVDWLNTLPGFPGMGPAENEAAANMQIYFTDYRGLQDRMGEKYAGNDGAVIFWYQDHRIYDATVCYVTEVDQETRNSIILEEIYNGLGPVQDTWLREDSLVYAGYSTPQSMTEVDRLILTLLYHPDIQCGMNSEECATVIRQLYY